MNIDLSGVFTTLIVIGIIIGLFFFWGCWELIDWLWIDHNIYTKTLLIPEVKIAIENGVADTTYIYKIP